METLAEKRNRKIQNIKCSLSRIPILSKNVGMVRQKLQQKQFNDACKISESFSTSQKAIGADQILQSKFDSNYFEKKYTIGRKIGEGANGLVRQCLHLRRNKIYALKTMMIDEEHVPTLKKIFLNVQKLNHDSIVKYKSLYLDLTKHLSYLVMEYIQWPNLLQYFENKAKPISQNEIKWIFYELFNVLHYLHSKNICHRDIKPDNILIDINNRKIKIIDFGICKSMEIRKNKIPMFTNIGTLFYRAPEMFQGAGYNEKVDVWAAAITLFQVIMKKTPFQSIYHSETISRIIERPLFEDQTIRHNFSKLLQKFLERLLEKNPLKRISARQAMNNLWFDQPNKKSSQKGKKRSMSFNSSEYTVTEYSKFVPKLKQANQGLLHMKQFVDEINGNDFHRIETDNF